MDCAHPRKFDWGDQRNGGWWCPDCWQIDEWLKDTPTERQAALLLDARSRSIDYGAPGGRGRYAGWRRGAKETDDE